MLPCIVCTKNVDDDEDAEVFDAIPKSAAEKDGLKSLTSQLKDIVWKASVVYRHCKPGSAAIFDRNAPSVDSYETASSTSSNVTCPKSSSQLGIAASSAKENTSFSSSRLDGLKAEKGSGELLEYPYDRKSQLVSKQPAISPSLSLRDDAGVEWVAQVEPGVLITFLSLPDGGNELKRIRFSREMFNKWQAETWWTANSERVHALYNVESKEKQDFLPNSLSSKEVAANIQKVGNSPNSYDAVNGQMIKAGPSSSADDISTGACHTSADSGTGNGSDWVTEDEPGIFITVNVLPGGSKTLKRVRFSCDRFNEQQAKLWWEKNRFRVHEQYLRTHIQGASFTSI